MAELSVDPMVIGRAEETGAPVIGNRRIPVGKIALWHEQKGWELDDIATECGLTLEEVQAALAYYHAHPAECDGAP